MKSLRIAVLATVSFTALSAAADEPPPTLAVVADDLFGNLLWFDSGPADAGAQRFGFLSNGTWQADKPFGDDNGARGSVVSKNLWAAHAAADTNIAWVSSDLDEYGYCGSCGLDRGKPTAHAHVTMIFDKGPLWHPVAWSISLTVTGAEQVKALQAKVVPPALAKKIDAGAEDAAKLFETSLADPTQLAASVSDRKEALLYGSDLAERYVGGAKVKAQLKKWNLKFTVRDGVQAGLVGTSIAWVAANVDASSIKNAKAAPQPYRLFAIYEKTAGAWKLVTANFSVLGQVKQP